jgi:hypothetical protein
MVLSLLNGELGTTAGVEIIGLNVSAAHDAYEMYVRPSLLHKEIQGPFFLLCDRVSRSLEPDAAAAENRVVAASQLQISKKRKVPS